MRPSLLELFLELVNVEINMAAKASFSDSLRFSTSLYSLKLSTTDVYSDSSSVKRFVDSDLSKKALKG